MHVVYFVVDTALIIRKDELSKPTMNLFQIVAAHLPWAGVDCCRCTSLPPNRAPYCFYTSDQLKLGTWQKSATDETIVSEFSQRNTELLWEVRRGSGDFINITSFQLTLLTPSGYYTYHQD